MGVQIGALVALLLVTVALGIEIRAWVTGARLINRSQKVYRVMAGIMMDAVLLMVVFGPAVHARRDPLFEISYWGLSILLAGLVVVVALFDVRLALIAYRNRRSEAFHTVFGEERQEE